jgi:N-acetyl-anhydromuramyl-L-alanine amidase AmpD
MSTLRKGSTGPAVAALQRRLGVVADGDFGEVTKAAVEAFQRRAGLEADGIAGPKTLAALNTPAAVPQAASAVPLDWMPPCSMERIIVHWTAGQHRASAECRAHYHVLIEGDGKLVRGIPSIDLNARPSKPGYAAHTLSCNSGSIGVALCCMAGAIENPFDPGPAPMTRVQWDVLPTVLAALCRRYAIPVAATTVLSHAEVQGTLGVPQRGKWDIARLAFDPSVKGARACGDLFRAATAALLAGGA